MPNRLICFLFFFLISAVSLHSAALNEKHLSLFELGLLVLQGEQEGVYEKGNYVVVGNVIIPQGDTMTILAGSKIFFSQGRTIKIHGTLIFQGEPGNPITIVDAPFRLDKPSLMDSILTGGASCISVSTGANLTLKNTIINDTTLSIISESNFGEITFDSTVFTAETNSKLTIGDSTVTVPYSRTLNFKIKAGEYPVILEEIVIEDVNSQSVTIPVVSEHEMKKPKWVWPVRILSAAVTGAGAVAWYYYNDKMDSYSEKFNTASDTYTADNYYEKNKDASKLRNLGIAAVITGTTSFTLTFIIKGVR